MVRTSAAIAALEAKVASVLGCRQSRRPDQRAMASNAAPPELGNAAGNVPTPSPYPTSARKHPDLSPADAESIQTIADTDEKIAGAEAMMESAGAKMKSGRAESAGGAAKMKSEGLKIAGMDAAPESTGKGKGPRSSPAYASARS
jgi:hypothetical protein